MKANKQKYMKSKTDWSEVARKNRAHRKGTTLTTLHKRRIKRGLREYHATKDGTLLKATNTQTNDIMWFTSGAEAARRLGCSRQLVSQCLRLGRGPNSNWSAKGWRIERVAIDDITIGGN